MIKKLDTYIGGKFLKTFFFVVLLFMLISVFIDFSEKVEKFIESGISMKEILIDYYPNFVLYISGLLWPLFTLIAVIFFTSRMAGNSEIIAILNAGVSFKRLLRPYLIVSSLLAIMLLAGNHYFIPKGNVTRLNIEHQYIWKNNDKGKKSNVHMFLSPTEKVYLNSFNKNSKTARNFRLERFKDGELVYMIKANPAKWLGPPNRWQLQNYEIREFNGKNESLILGKGLEMDTTINLTPEDFVDYLNQQTMMTSVELKSYIDKRKSRGLGNVEKYEIELHKRTADAVTIIILTIIGLSIAGRKVRGGLGLHLALGILIGALFVFLSRFSTVFATGQVITPFWGIWLPNILFGLVAVILVQKAQK